MEKDPNTQGRRAASRATKLRRRKARMNFFLLLGIAAVIVILIIVTPKEPIRRATYSTGTESGMVESSGHENLSAYTGLVISEVMPSNAAAVTDENGNYTDWIEIWNSTDHTVSLEGLGLSDKGDRIRFLFPDVSLEADGRVVVFCDNTNQSDPNRAFHAKFKLSSVGETVYLYDPNAYLIDSCKYPIMASDESWALTDSGFKNVTWFSPWFENTEEGHRKYRESISVENGSIVINEVMADPMTGLRDDEVGLSDNEGKPLKWRFPDGAKIPARGYYLVLCTGKDRMDRIKNAPHSNFRISAENETIILTDSQGHVLDRVMIDNLPMDCSWGRNDEGQLQVFEIATPSLPNNQTGFNQMDINLRAMNKTGVFISEVMASNDSIATYPKAAFTDWVEIYNSGSEAVDLSDWGLSDRLDHGRKWQFPRGTMIAAGEYKVILCDKRTDKNSASEPHAAFRIGKLGRETITLADPTGKVLDKMRLPEMRTDVSFGRTLGIAGLFYYDTPTPFQANRDGFSGYADMPSFSLEPGQYFQKTYVQIAVPANTQVFYTTDGADPTQNSNPYNGEQLELNFTTVLRARAFSTGDIRPSDILTGTYFINTYHSLPLVSVVTDPDNLWNKETGMLVTGDNVFKEPGKLPFKNTVYRKVKDAGVKNEVHVELYDDSGTKLIDQDCCFSLMGDFSLDMPQKSFKFRAKSKYGAKTFAAKLFPDRPYTEYKSFVLRNSGNDSMWTRLQDGFQSRLIDYYQEYYLDHYADPAKEGYYEESKVAHLAWKPYVVYLNGVYWGNMNLRERTDRYMLAQFEGLTLDQADDMDLLQGNGRLKYGSTGEWKRMLKKIKAGNPAKNQEDLDYILENVDVNNLFEYIAFEMFFGNSDIGNTRFYRFHTDGSKWKWVLYDVDYGLYNSKFNSPKSFTKEKGMGEKNVDNTILRKLLSVPEYRDRYLTIYGDIFKALTCDNMLNELEKLVELIRPEMQLHWARWGEENDTFVLQEVPTTVDGAYRYWEKRVERLRNVIRLRPTRLWEFTQDAFNLSNEQMVHYFGEKPEYPPEAIP